MASSVSFKQECPSCEALVPIRDASLVGKKIDCPKCKFRFVVEAPEEEESKSDAKAPAKSDKVTNAKPANGKAVTGKAPAKASPAGKNGKPTKKVEDEDEEDEAPSKKKKKKSGSSMTLILGLGVGLVAVVGLIVGALCFWPSGGSTKGGQGGGGGAKPPNLAAGGNTGGTTGDTKNGNETSKPPAGSALADVSNLLPNGTETVVSLNMPLLRTSSFRMAALGTPGAFQASGFQKSFGFPLEDVQRVILAYQAGPKNAVFSVLRTSKPVQREQLAASLKLDSLPPVNGLNLHIIRQRLDALSNFLLKGNQPQDIYYLHIFDDHTVVFANKDVMEKFLNDNAKPRFLTQPPAPPTPGGQPQPGAQPQPKGKAALPNPSSGTELAGKDVADDAFALEPGYQFVSFGIKQEGRPRPGSGKPAQPAPGGQPGTKPAEGTAPTVVAPVTTESFMTVQPPLKNVLDKAEVPGQPPLILVATLGTSKFSREFGKLLVDAYFKQSGITNKNLLPKIDPLQNVQGLALTLNALYESKVSGTLALEGYDEQSKTQLELGLRMVGGVLPVLIKTALDLDVSGFDTPAVVPSPSPMPQQPMPPAVNKSRGGSLALNKYDGVLVMSVELSLKEPAYRSLMEGLALFFVQVKSYAELTDARPRVHELAAALQAYVKDKGAFPRGTAERKAEGDSNAPDTRLSWLVDLLPYLDEGNYRDIRFNPNAVWWDNENLLGAQMIVPQFLARTRPDQPAQVHYGTVATPVGGTNFVGMAGLGYDAAYYRADDAAVANKLGVIGYNRVTKVSDIKGGLDKTIVLILVSPDHPTPWIAGGGATVRGVSDDPTDASPIGPFVCMQRDGKDGTLAIMGDGKVRFIPKSIGNDVFRQLCTINGPKPAGNLDLLCPVLPPTETASELKTQPLPVAPKPTTPPALPPPPPTSSESSTSAGPDGWKAYTPANGSFQLLFPGQPTIAFAATLGLQTEMVYFKRQVKEGLDYGLQWNMDAKRGKSKAENAAFLKTVQAETVKGFKGKLAEEKELDVAGMQSREFYVELPNSEFMHFRAFAHDIYFFGLFVQGMNKSAVQSKDAESFFASFKLKGAAAGK